MKSAYFWRVRSTRVRRGQLPDRTWQQLAISARALDASLKLLQPRPRHRGAMTERTPPLHTLVRLQPPECHKAKPGWIQPRMPRKPGFVAVSTYPQRSKPQFPTTTAVSKPRQTSLEVKRASPQVPRASSQTTSVSPSARRATRATRRAWLQVRPSSPAMRLASPAMRRVSPAMRLASPPARRATFMWARWQRRVKRPADQVTSLQHGVTPFKHDRTAPTSAARRSSARASHFRLVLKNLTSCGERSRRREARPASALPPSGRGRSTAGGDHSSPNYVQRNKRSS